MADKNVQLAQLEQIFGTQFTRQQIHAIYEFTGYCLDTSLECLLSGENLLSLLQAINGIYSQKHPVKLDTSEEEAWKDTVAFYKSPHLDMTCQLRVEIAGQPAIDVGGVRAMLYTTIYTGFASNAHVKLFDGPARKLYPTCSAEARSSGLFKILGMMVGHSIMQDGVGFPYLSPTCYWYIIDNKMKALQNLSLQDVDRNAALIIAKVNKQILKLPSGMHYHGIFCI